MKTVIPEETVLRLAKASVNTCFRTKVAAAVTARFKSMHYMSSKLICDCTVLNILLNDKVTTTSADEIITCIRRSNRSLYTTVESAFFPIRDKFEMYARSVLGQRYERVSKSDMRITNYIVYVLSADLTSKFEFDKDEIYYNAYTYGEIRNMTEFPHY